MTRDQAFEHIKATIKDLRELHPRFVRAIDEYQQKLSAYEAAKNDQYSADDWVRLAYHSALIKLRLILEQHFSYVETLGLLAVTRYTFETMVWLRTLDQDSRFGFVFYAQIIDKQLQHLASQRRKMESEIELFGELAKKDSPTANDDLIKLLKNASDESSMRLAAAAMQKVSDEVDREARRRFSTYALDAKENGYSFQAYLMREKGLPKIDELAAELTRERARFLKSADSSIASLVKRPWKWRERAAAVGMKDNYDFIYGYTSRLLHATPVSVFTNQKNLEPDEMLTFMEYIYVSCLDALELADKHRP